MISGVNGQKHSVDPVEYGFLRMLEVEVAGASIYTIYLAGQVFMSSTGVCDYAVVVLDISASIAGAYTAYRAHLAVQELFDDVE